MHPARQQQPALALLTQLAAGEAAEGALAAGEAAGAGEAAAGGEAAGKLGPAVEPPLSEPPRVEPPAGDSPPSEPPPGGPPSNEPPSGESSHAGGEQAGPEQPSDTSPFTLRKDQGFDWTEPQTLDEKLAMEQAVQEASAPYNADNIVMDGPFNDVRYSDPGWKKFGYTYQTADGNEIVIHYTRNVLTGETDQFKFVSQFSGSNEAIQSMISKLKNLKP